MVQIERERETDFSREERDMIDLEREEALKTRARKENVKEIQLP
jgi:hypothetical protein